MRTGLLIFLMMLMSQSLGIAQTGSAAFWKKPNRWVQATSSGTPPIVNQGAFIAHSSTKVFIFGGYQEPAVGYVGTGGIYDIATGVWTTLPAGGPTARGYGCAAWDGTTFIVYGGWGGAGAFADGKRYNPATNTWSSNVAAGPSGLYPGCAWTGSEMIYWGGQNPVNNVDYNTGSRYNPTTNTWTAMAASPIAARRAPQIISHGSKVFVWGGWKDLVPVGEFNDGAMYDPVANTWSAVSATNAPTARGLTSIASNGSVIVVWGGQTRGDVATPGGAIYNPTANTWTTISMTNAPQSPLTNGVTTFDDLFFFYGGWTGTANFDGGKFFNATTNTWTNAKTAFNPSPRSRPFMMQVDRKIFLFGGWGYSSNWFYAGDSFWYTP